MRINGTGLGLAPAEIRSTGPSSGDEVSSLPVADLRPRGGVTAGALPPRSALPSSEALGAEVTAQMKALSSLLDSGGLEVLKQCASDGFKSLPPRHRSLGMQTARLLHVVSEPEPTTPVMPFPAIERRMEAMVAASSQLIEASRLDLTTALHNDPQQRASMLAPYLDRINETGRVTAAAIARTPVAELRANRETLKEQLSTWASSTEKLHEQLRGQFGDTHPVTVTALEARTEASAINTKTLARMAVAKLGSTVFNMTVGPLISGAARLLGRGG